MERIQSLYSTSIGKKIVMAAAGIVLAAWILLHMVGNLKIFFGEDAFNHYSEFLRLVGAPVFGESQLLWVMRLILIAALLVHVVAVAQLYSRSNKARAVGYRKFDPQVFSYASRTMLWGGIALLLFVVYHILHFTTGQAHRDFVPGNPYHNLVSAFQTWWVVLIYLAALASLGLHLYHGTWSALQTYGFSNPRYNSYRRPASLAVALAVSVGFALVPLAVLFGIIA